MSPRPAGGQPALVSHALYYVSAHLDGSGLERVARLSREEAGVAPLADAPAGVEVCRRGEYLFLLNHGDEPVRLDVPPGLELLRGEEVQSPLELDPLGVAVLRL